MESAVNYNCLDNAEYMAAFDVEMTYRMSSQIVIPYLRSDHVQGFKEKEIVPFERKKDAIVYIQSNCAASSGRDDILRAVMAQGIQVDARGSCLNNAPTVPRDQSKVDAMREYKFCATMENSKGVDYVSEKMWDGLVSGCLPIYLGAPNIQEHLPAPNAVIDYVRLGNTPEALVAELQRLMHDKGALLRVESSASSFVTSFDTRAYTHAAAYEAHFAWRYAPLEELGEGYQRLVADTQAEHSQCRLCKLVASMRAERAPTKRAREAQQAAVGGGEQQRAAAGSEPPRTPT
jgi:alpha-1,3-fucosyltransferase 10